MVAAADKRARRKEGSSCKRDVFSAIRDDATTQPEINTIKNKNISV